MLVSILRYIKGYVRFQATGNSPERLLNLAAARGIPLWEPQPTEGGLSACMSARDYRAIRPLTKRARVKTRVTDRRGLPFVLRKCRGRAGLFAGAVAGAILLVVLSQFLWSYEIVGANHVSEQAIRYVGMTYALGFFGILRRWIRGSMKVDSHKIVLHYEMTWLCGVEEALLRYESEFGRKETEE